MKQGQPGRSDLQRQRLLVQAALAMWRSRIARLLAVALVVAVIGSAFYVSSLWTRAISPECETWARIDMPISDVIALKRRMETYQADEDPEARLELTGDEITALLRDEFPYAVRLWFTRDRVEATIVIPAEGGCYNAHFTGRARIEERVAVFEPEHLSIGETDLTPWMTGQMWPVEAASLERRLDPRVARALENTELLTITDGRVQIRLYDRYQMPW